VANTIKPASVVKSFFVLFFARKRTLTLGGFLDSLADIPRNEESRFVNLFLHGGNYTITHQKLQQKKQNLDFCKSLQRKDLGGG
jgi:hypothetical protein